MIPTLVQGLAMDCLPTLQIMSQEVTPVRRFGEKHFQMLVQAYSATHHMGKAMKMTGFSAQTCYSYLARFPEKLEEFKRLVEAPMFARIGELGQEQHDWRAFAWCLERTQPEKYALTSVSSIEHSGSVEHQVKMVPESDLHRIAAITREIECEVTRDD
jgi:hypothetical protein